MEKITYQGRIIEVVEDTIEKDGKERVFEYARRSPGVRLIIPKGDQILVTKEYRHELKGYDYRLPGGKVFDTLTEFNSALTGNTDIAELAKTAGIKEAHEEAGIEVEEASFFHCSICGATVIWDLYYFVVERFTEAAQHLEEGEDIEVLFVKKEKLKEMCLDGSMSEERSALTLLRYIENF